MTLLKKNEQNFDKLFNVNELNRLTIRMVGKLENFVVFNVKEKNMETHKKIKNINNNEIVFW